MYLSQSSVLIYLTESQFSKGFICLLIHIQIWISSLRFSVGGTWTWYLSPLFPKWTSKRHQINSALEIPPIRHTFWERVLAWHLENLFISPVQPVCCLMLASSFHILFALIPSFVEWENYFFSFLVKDACLALASSLLDWRKASSLLRRKESLLYSYTICFSDMLQMRFWKRGECLRF